MRSLRFAPFSVVCGIFLAVSGIASSVSAQSDAIVVVNSAADPGDGVCDETECTLREALDLVTSEGSGLSNPVLIKFNIPGAGPHTIQPRSPFPTIGGKYVTIDGYSQPGSVENTNEITAGLNAVLMIELDGSLAGEKANGLELVESRVSGIAINRFSGYGVVSGGEMSGISGCFIGTDLSGQFARGNKRGGIYSWGDTGIYDNLVSGNYRNGIIADGLDFVFGNLVGVNVTGKAPLGNEKAGILAAPHYGVEIGKNVIGANETGIVVDGYAIVFDNIIGAMPGDDPALANRGDGIYLYSGPGELSNNRIMGNGGAGIRNAGPYALVTHNTIANNAGAGIVAQLGDYGHGGSQIQNNAVFDNGGLGIDLGDDGPTPNDPGDADTGPNERQNFPVIETVERSAAVIARGSLSSAPRSSYTLEFFSSRRCDPSGYGEGETPLSTLQVTTDDTGVAHFETAIRPAFTQPYVTATATQGQYTSEFSKCTPVVIRSNRFALPAGQHITYNSADPRAPKGVVTFDVTYRNPYAVTLENVYFKAVRLEYKNPQIPGEGLVVLNADGGPAHANARILVPGGIPANGTVTVRYEIGLPYRAPFRLAADAYGIVAGAIREGFDDQPDDTTGWAGEVDNTTLPPEPGLEAPGGTLFLPGLQR